jgi:N-acetylneuraminate lyase
MIAVTRPLHGLTAAVHTPFDANGDINLDIIEKQAEHLLNNRVSFAFVCGTTGECHSLTVDERMAMAKRWLEVSRSTNLGVVVHVGANCLRDCQSLARDAQSRGALAVASLSPSYFRPPTLDALVDSMASIASACPGLPFYFYDIPILTNVQMSMLSFLETAETRIPNLVGLKFTNADLVSYLQILQHQNGKWDIPFGFDELLLAARALGAKGAVGSTYNLGAPIYHRLLKAVDSHDLDHARVEQRRSIDLIKKLSSVGMMGAAKATMEFLGVRVGAPRLPNTALTAQTKQSLRQDLEAMGFFDWIKP